MRLSALRESLLVGGLFLAACGSMPAPQPPAIPGPTFPSGGDDTCGAAPHTHVVGQPATALERLLIMRQVRLIRPNTPVTEEFSPQRINFHISAPDVNGVEWVSRITCG